MLAALRVRLGARAAVAGRPTAMIARPAIASIVSAFAPASASVSSSMAVAIGSRGIVTGEAHYNQFAHPKKNAVGKFISLDALRPAPGSRHHRVMLGRGEGTHFGKSAGRGMRGTYHRHQLRKRNFEGGQTPLHRSMPKRGYPISPLFMEKFQVVSLGTLQYLCETGRIDPRFPIQLKDLKRCGIKPKKDGIKIIGDGAHRLTFPIHVEVSRIDDLAKFAIEKAGGNVKLVYFTRLGLRAHLFPQKFAILPRASNIPPPKKRHIYMPYDDTNSIPPLLFKSRITPTSPLAKYWTPNPIATKYLRAQAHAEARATGKTVDQILAAAAPVPSAGDKKATA